MTRYLQPTFISFSLALLLLTGCGGNSEISNDNPAEQQSTTTLDDNNISGGGTNTNSTAESLSDDIIPNEYIVVLHEQPSASSYEKTSNANRPSRKLSLNGESVSDTAERLFNNAIGTSTSSNNQKTSSSDSQLRDIYQYAITGFAARLNAEEVTYLLAQPEVNYIEPVIKAHPLAIQSNPGWALDRIDQENLPLNNSYAYNATGKDVHVYIWDFGVRTSHQEFTGRIGGWNALGNEDLFSHGTGVASIVAGSTYGLAKDATIYSANIMSGPGKQNSLAPIEWIIEHLQRPAVVNMSWGAGLPQESVRTAINNAIDSGVIFVAGTPNGVDYDACNSYPTGYNPKIIVVGATYRDDSIKYATGPCVDIYAPGDDVKMADIASDTASKTGEGSSFATPQVTGAVALYLEDHPNASIEEVTDAILGSASAGKLKGIVLGGTPNLLLNTSNIKRTVKPLPISNDFQSNFGWKNVGQHKWVHDAGGTPSRDTGPSSGSEGTSYSRYAFMETSSRYAYTEENSAELISDLFNPDGGTIVQFDYHMYGSDIGELRVEILNGNETWQTFWSKTGQQQSSSSAAWRHVSIQLPNVSRKNTRIRFRGIAAGGWKGDIAIDQILIQKGVIVQPSPPPVIGKWNKGSIVALTPGTADGTSAPSGPCSPGSVYHQFDQHIGYVGIDTAYKWTCI